MLVLTRRVDESIRIGDDIRITVVKIKGTQICVGVDAPRDVPVLHEELLIDRSEVSDEVESSTRNPLFDPEVRVSLNDDDVRPIDLKTNHICPTGLSVCFPEWLSASDSKQLLHRLRADMEWMQGETLFGRFIDEPA